MKEVQRLYKDKVSIVKQAEHEKQIKLVGRIRPQRGHTLFEINLKTGEILEAEFEPQVAVYSETLQLAKFKRPAKKVMVNKDCIYISALNKKNVLKKLKRGYA